MKMRIIEGIGALIGVVVMYKMTSLRGGLPGFLFGGGGAFITGFIGRLVGMDSAKKIK